MKKWWLVIAIIACIVCGFIIVRAIHYYSGGQLAQQVDETRAKKEVQVKKAVAKKARAAKTAARKARQEKQAKPIDLDQFYRNIELTALQKAYAEKVIAALEEQQKPLRQELLTLRKETDQALWDFMPEPKKASISMADLRKMSLEQILPDIDQPKREQAETIYQQFLTKRKEINKSLRQSKKLATKMLLAILTPDQKKIYRREHPPKTPAQKRK